MKSFQFTFHRPKIRRVLDDEGAYYEIALTALSLINYVRYRHQRCVNVRLLGFGVTVAWEVDAGEGWS